jgi:hypothetical protein
VARTPRWFPAFIEAIGCGATVSKACELGDVSTTYVYRLRARSEWFAAEWAAAEERFRKSERQRARCMAG